MVGPQIPPAPPLPLPISYPASAHPSILPPTPRADSNPSCLVLDPCPLPPATSQSNSGHHPSSSPPLSAPPSHIFPSSTPDLTVPAPLSTSSLPSSLGLIPTPRPVAASLRVQSFAQVTSSSRGPGFVRAHANEVESFARLPRTGVNIICGSKDGIPSFSFAHSDLSKVENLYSNALVMKFHGGRPSLESSHREIRSWGMVYPFSIGPLNSRSFLIRFQDSSDLLKVLSRPSSILITFPYKIFRWHNRCHLKEESCMVPIWVSLPRLPLQCFIPEFLEAVANKVGRFLCFDKATSTLARPSAARMCIEVDLRKSLPQFIWVGLFDGYKQPIIYEKLPKFCNQCFCQGHMDVACPKYRQGQAANPNPASHLIINPPPAVSPGSERVLDMHCSPPPVRPIVPMLYQLQPQGSFTPPISQGREATPSPASLTIPSPPLAVSSDSIVISAPAANQFQIQHPLPSNQSPRCPLTSKTNRRPLSSQSNPGDPNAASSTQHPPVSPSSRPQSDLLVCRPDVCHNAEPHISVPAVEIGYNQAVGTDGYASIVCRTDALNQPPLQFLKSTSFPSAAEGTPTVCHNAAGSYRVSNDALTASNLSTSVSIAIQVDNQQPNSSNIDQISTIKSHLSKPFGVGKSTKLSQQQMEAMERFKLKVQEQDRIHNVHLNRPYSGNQFEALLDDRSDDDDFVASYNSDTDDVCVEPIEMGYQSADGCPSNSHKNLALSGTKINKRHPNIPLNVRLRSRKSSYPSSP